MVLGGFRSFHVLVTTLFSVMTEMMHVSLVMMQFCRNRGP